MAKKKPTRKKSTSKKKVSKDKPNYVLLIFILILVGGLVVYGLLQTSELSDLEFEFTQVENSNNNSNDSNNERKPGRNKSNASSEESNDQKKFVPEDLNDKDDLTEEITTNDNLPQYKSGESYYYTNSFDFAWPKYNDNEQIIEHEFYALSYNEKYEQANWVAYSLTKKNLGLSQFERKDNFQADPDIRSGSATPDDYKKSGYDRGHLAPAADFTWTEKGLDDSFYMSNISPQEPQFNQGIWKKLESKVRSWANDNKKLFIVTGPIFNKRTKRIGKNKVEVPTHFYKVILDIEEPELKSIAFVMENKKLSGNIMRYAVTVDSVETLSGFDFFPAIPDPLEKNLESAIDKRLWK